MKLSALRTAAGCLLLFAARLSASQTLTLTLSSLEIHADNTVRLKLLLNAPSNSAPAGLQWTLRLSPGLEIVRIEAGKAAKKAHKTLVCNGAKCLIYGMNRTTIRNGPVALVEIKVDQSLAGGEHPAPLKYPDHGRARTTESEIQVGDVVAVTLNAKVIPVEPTSPQVIH